MSSPASQTPAEKLIETLKLIQEYCEWVPHRSLEQAEESLSEIALFAKLSVQEYEESVAAAVAAE